LNGVIYECETWSLILREERTLRVFEKRMLRRRFRPRRDEVKWEWTRLHKKELYAVNSSPDIIRVIKSKRLRLAGYVARLGREEVQTGL
jgi:hypothetical protein